MPSGHCAEHRPGAWCKIGEGYGRVLLVAKCGGKEVGEGGAGRVWFRNGRACSNVEAEVLAVVVVVRDGQGKGRREEMRGLLKEGVERVEIESRERERKREEGWTHSWDHGT